MKRFHVTTPCAVTQAMYNPAMTIKTVKDLVTHYGGTCAFAKAFDLSPQSVSNAINSQKLPHSWRLPIYADAQKRGVKVSDKLLGVKP